jgi:GrpB-like predicted nucleotidyltransferase (UPF0157 family)
MFSLVAERIRAALSERALLLEHVGSTVPGLSAKPIIDMVLAVEDSADEVSYVPPLESRGGAPLVPACPYGKRRAIGDSFDDTARWLR